jgi:hypothetical protein
MCAGGGRPVGVASARLSSSCWFRGTEFVVFETAVGLASDLVCRQVPVWAIGCRV